MKGSLDTSMKVDEYMVENGRSDLGGDIFLGVVETGPGDETYEVILESVFWTAIRIEGVVEEELATSGIDDGFQRMGDIIEMKRKH